MFGNDLNVLVARHQMPDSIPKLTVNCQSLFSFTFYVQVTFPFINSVWVL
jgi:hypothetical protein